VKKTTKSGLLEFDKRKTGCNHRAGQEVEQTACRQEQNTETAQRQHQNHQSMCFENEKTTKSGLLVFDVMKQQESQVVSTKNVK